MFKRRKKEPRLMDLLEIIHNKVKVLQVKGENMSTDNIYMEISSIMDQLDLFNQSPVVSFAMNNVEYIEEIYSDVERLKYKFLKSNQREEIYKKLENSFDYHLPVERKFAMTEWLYNELELSTSFSHREVMVDLDGQDVWGVRVVATVSSRQLVTMKASINGSRDGNVHVAFHEMIDFIENNRINIDSPFNIYEKACLKVMCENILALR
ncbi:hypothetical protein QTG56_25845 (plasmid) [Rossellomorea sp. AcN35-11]|nr:hypothetical protein [Rossellomorea aquimaris]WJV32040.1 hypothetical protein QTG56_25845 [Rossellomorea sp. AcN35-11]